MNKIDYQVIQVPSDFIGANCYIIRNSDTTIIIDPCVSVNELKKHGVFELDGVLVTHAHADHILYLEKVLKEYDTTAYFAKQAVEKIFNDDLNLSNMMGRPLKIKEVNYKTIKDNDKLTLGSIDIDCIYTPGHSDCSMCFLIDKDLFTGDTLFNLGIGRTDLYSGNFSKIRESLKKLSKLDGKLAVYPGHETTSTLEFELNNNIQMKELIK